MNDQIVSTYTARFDSLKIVARKLEQHLISRLSDQSHIDRISCRAKSPLSFAEKATQRLEDGSTPKYSAPLLQIQDQIGARVLVLYLRDVDNVREAVEKYFTPMEKQEHLPHSPSSFGYVGFHGIYALPEDVIPEKNPKGSFSRCFELQIKTLFQHAWAEANHDLVYKPRAVLSSDQLRLNAYAAAQAWGADRVFEELRESLTQCGGEPIAL